MPPTEYKRSVAVEFQSLLRNIALAVGLGVAAMVWSHFTAESRLGLLTAGEVTVSDEGVLDIRKGTRTYHYDLYDRATTIEVTGTPGSRRWKVEFGSPTEAGVTVDAKMVDAEAFTRELQRWRPEALG